jgi:hypothetical protein
LTERIPQLGELADQDTWEETKKAMRVTRQDRDQGMNNKLLAQDGVACSLIKGGRGTGGPAASMRRGVQATKPPKKAKMSSAVSLPSVRGQP